MTEIKTQEKSETFKFEPSTRKTTVPTGAHILDELDARGVSYPDFEAEIGPDAPSQDELATGSYLMPEEMGRRIAAYFGWEAEIVNRLEASFQEAKAAGKEVLTASTLPPEKDFSGKLLVRMPVTLHKRLAGLAKQEKISLNQLTLSIIAEGVGRLTK